MSHPSRLLHVPARDTDDPLAALTCQPSADAACGACPDCREKESRLFDDLLLAHLAAIARASKEPGADH